jgi:predicted component of type VI protein secretion system
VAVLRIHAPVLGRQERVLEWDGRPLTVGRDESCDVVLLEQAASRHHARFERRGEALVVTDLGSANGVWVGPTRIDGSRALHDGDVVRIGDTTLALVLDPHRQPTLYRPEGAPPPSLTSAATVDPGPPRSPAPAPAPAPVPAPAPARRSASVYSLGSEPLLAADHEPSLLGLPDRSSPSAYSLGPEPMRAPDEPEALGPLDGSSPSVYSLGGEGVGSSLELGAAPPRPHAPLASPPPAAASVEPFAPAPPRPPVVVPPPAHAAASSWEWSEPSPEPRRRHGRPAGPTLWLGLGLFIGGVLAMLIALAAGYVPRDLASLLGAAHVLGGGP